MESVVTGRTLWPAGGKLDRKGMVTENRRDDLAGSSGAVAMAEESPLSFTPADRCRTASVADENLDLVVTNDAAPVLIFAGARETLGPPSRLLQSPPIPAIKTTP